MQHLLQKVMGAIGDLEHRANLFPTLCCTKRESLELPSNDENNDERTFLSDISNLFCWTIKPRSSPRKWTRTAWGPVILQNVNAIWKRKTSLEHLLFHGGFYLLMWEKFPIHERHTRSRRELTDFCQRGIPYLDLDKLMRDHRDRSPSMLFIAALRTSYVQKNKYVAFKCETEHHRKRKACFLFPSIKRQAKMCFSLQKEGRNTKIF